MPESNDRRAQRIEKLNQLRELGIEPFPARTRRTLTTAEALEAWQEDDSQGPSVQVAGRLVAVRVMGGSAFAHVADGAGRLQIYLRRDGLGDEAYNRFCSLVDIGDFISAEGRLFRTRTGEVTVQVQAWELLAKTLQTLPEKWHGLRDVEIRYRQRYLDLIANQDVRRVFETRSRLVSGIRRFLDERGFLEVETPVLQPIYGGAAARPFTTHHNALDQTFYLRIADELYLKRLIVGGFDRVYEIGHNFRNEGVSTQHNPEFTLIELYQAYADYTDMMRLVETLYAELARQLAGGETISYQGHEIHLAPPWRRISMRDAILEYVGVDIEEHRSQAGLQAAARAQGVELPRQLTWGKLVEKLFELGVQPNLVQPTFIVDYPIEVSPLAKKKPGAPHLVERFEFFVGAMECGNAFTELNDPLDQRERFVEQAQFAAQGDAEAHPLDEDFLTALEYGMPPTGGLGIGVDRMVMLFTDQVSIREVILFPALRQRSDDARTQRDEQ